MEPECDLTSIPDDELLRRLGELLRQSRCVEADLVAHIGEVDLRRLYAREAAPSMFVYCTERLHLSEAEAYLRIAAARASREHPMLLEMLSDGRLHLTAIAKLAPRPDAPAFMRRLPERRAQTEPTAVSELRPDGVVLPVPTGQWDAVSTPAIGLRPDAVESIEPLAPARYKVQFTASAEFRDKLERLRALMRSSVPNGDLATIIEQAVTEKLERLEARRFATTKAPKKSSIRAESRPSSRHIPAAVRRAVHQRDGGRCRFVDEQGRRCTARDRLEFHHRHPFGHGGDGSLENIQLLCRSHNQYLAEHDYGRQAIGRHRRAPGRVSEGSAVYSIGSFISTTRRPGSTTAS